MKALTVGDLRKLLGPLVPDAMPICLRLDDGDGGTAVCGLHGITIESGCTDTLAAIFEGRTDEDEAGDGEEAPVSVSQIRSAS